jgi:endonuclease YncB( thermonuclease family)
LVEQATMKQWLGRALIILAAVLGQGAATAAAEIVSYAIVNDDATLRVRGKTIHLYGVDGGSTTAAPIDLGAYLIREGWAVALPEAPFAYHTYQEIAKVRRRGVWGFQADSITR